MGAWAKNRIDWIASAALVAAVVLYGAALVDFNVPPFEDAAMLMRYSDHLAHGHGIVWNIGEHPVDGATDFLFMAAVAALIKTGVGLGRSVRLLGSASHILTVLIVYWVNRRLWGAHPAISFLAALYLAAGTGLWYVAAFFGTTFFALFAAVTWTQALLISFREEAPSWLLIAFALSAFVTGLSRPEGVALAAFMMLAVVILKGWRGSSRSLWVFLAVMLVLGGAFFAWRWSYFGYPLPNPYYKKGGGLLHWDSFWESLGNLARFGGPFVLAFLLGLRSKKTMRKAIALLVPLVLFAASFILVSNETNFGGRFQYALWPLILLSFFPLVSGIHREVGFALPKPTHVLSRAAWVMTGLVVALAILRYAMAQSCSLTISQHTCAVAYDADGRYDVAKMLSAFQGNGYVMATTEAGLLPLYSGWTAIDAWGLNDAWIAHHGEVTSEYLDQYRPNLIVFHAYFSPLAPPRINEKNLAQDWFRMTIILKDYAESHDYVLAAVFGDSPYETHYYYVRRDFADSERIARALAGDKNYYWYATGRKAFNYAALAP